VIPFHAHPDVIAVVGLLAWGYAWSVRRLGPGAASRKQIGYFSAGLAVILVFSMWPLHDISERYLFSVHMAQHTFFSLVAPALLLLGCPPALLRWLTAPVAGVLRRLCRPVPASLLFNAVVVGTHWPKWVNYTVQHEWAHFLAHTLLFGAATVMWLPVINRDPSLPTLSPPARMLYLFVQSIVPTVPASFLAFAERPIYSWYAAAPRLTAMSAVEDQQVAGAVMKVGGATIIWTVIVVIFFRWYQESQRDQGDVLTWADVEREMALTAPAVGPTSSLPSSPASPDASL
jgi:putative membrane protein